ncbi:hypothetical protein [Burkholderia stagnalis]|uniref:hypothetical protein n=1 Tax=Burkholderia stagnalis TaxID=1503054 RepID=UPI0018C70CE9|nr:hypothetical protein [Burkholderia stagnalis]
MGAARVEQGIGFVSFRCRVSATFVRIHPCIPANGEPRESAHSPSSTPEKQKYPRPHFLNRTASNRLTNTR